MTEFEKVIEQVKPLLGEVVSLLPPGPPFQKRRMLLEILKTIPALQSPQYYYQQPTYNTKDEHSLRNALGKLTEDIQKIHRGEFSISENDYNRLISERQFINEALEAIIFGG